MSGLALVITEAGLDALVDAQAGNTANIQIMQLGLTEQSFVAAPTLDALPGEFKRIATVSGTSPAEWIIHMTAQDSSGDTYDLRGFGLFLDDGTLFASYSQADPIFCKVSIASFLFSVDVAFGDNAGASIDFGDVSFLYPPATETVKGVAEIATQEEVDAGTDNERIVTPLTLAAVVAAIVGGFTSATEAAEGVIELATQAETDAGADDLRAITPLKLAGRLATIIQSIDAESLARQQADSALDDDIDDETAARVAADNNLQGLITALTARTITGAGLVTGGGSLAANRVLQVLAASGAEIASGLLATKAVTPQAIAQVPQTFGAASSVIGLGGFIVKTGRVNVSWTAGANVTFPVAFPTACLRVLVTPEGNPNGGDEDDEPWWVDPGFSRTGFTIATAETGLTVPFAWTAFGH